MPSRLSLYRKKGSPPSETPHSSIPLGSIIYSLTVYRQETVCIVILSHRITIHLYVSTSCGFNASYSYSLAWYLASVSILAIGKALVASEVLLRDLARHCKTPIFMLSCTNWSILRNRIWYQTLDPFPRYSRYHISRIISTVKNEGSICASSVEKIWSLNPIIVYPRAKLVCSFNFRCNWHFSTGRLL